MAKKEDANAPAVTGNVMFYENPVPLNKAQHAKFGVKQVDKPYSFMADQHFLPLTAPEFGSASTSMPIIFAGEERSPLAVMGIRSGENLFVDEGQFQPDFYLPAFARRYPFVLAGDNANDRFVVCVDEKAECVTNKFERDRQATQKMIDDFKALDLFEPKEMNFQGNNADGTPAPRQKIADYFAASA